MTKPCTLTHDIALLWDQGNPLDFSQQFPDSFCKLFKQALQDNKFLQGNIPLFKKYYTDLTHLTLKGVVPIEAAQRVIDYLIQHRKAIFPELMVNDIIFTEGSCSIEVSSLIFIRYTSTLPSYLTHSPTDRKVEAFSSISPLMGLTVFKPLYAYMTSYYSPSLALLHEDGMRTALYQCALWKLDKLIPLLEREVQKYVQSAFMALVVITEAEVYELPLLKAHALSFLKHPHIRFLQGEGDTSVATLNRICASDQNTMEKELFEGIVLIQQKTLSKTVILTFSRGVLKVDYREESHHKEAPQEPLLELQNDTSITLNDVDHLDLRGHQSTSEILRRMVLGLIMALPHLITINLEGSVFADDEFISLLLKAKPEHLAYLNLGSCSIKEKNLIAVLDTFHHLKLLTINTHIPLSESTKERLKALIRNNTEAQP